MSPTMSQLSIFALAALCLVVLVSAGSVQKGEQYEIGSDGAIFPFVPECKSDEMPVPFKPTECEPSCDGQEKSCLKIFYYDLTSCFCKDGLVRNKATKKCVKKEDC